MAFQTFRCDFLFLHRLVPALIYAQLRLWKVEKIYGNAHFLCFVLRMVGLWIRLQVHLPLSLIISLLAWNSNSNQTLPPYAKTNKRFMMMTWRTSCCEHLNQVRCRKRRKWAAMCAIVRGKEREKSQHLFFGFECLSDFVLHLLYIQKSLLDISRFFFF